MQIIFIENIAKNMLSTKSKVFFFFQNKATFPLVRKDYYIETIRRLIHTSGRLPPIKSKKMSPLTLPCGLT